MFERLDHCKVLLDRKIVDAMRALDRGGAEIALVVDESGRLQGTLTDGDVRRAILGGAALDSPLAPHIHRNFTSVAPSSSRAEVLDLMQARTIGQIPVVDGDGVVVGLHLLREVVGVEERPNCAIIMAGGKGTRLRPITENIPKPMIRVAGRPILERLVLHLVGFGIRHIHLSINYLGHVVERHFGDGSRFGCRIEYLREERPLGTAGALSLLPEPPKDPLLVVNGDLVTTANTARMLDFHEAGKYAATMAVRDYLHTVPYGCVETDGDLVRKLDEKPMLTRMVNAGIYVLDPEVVSAVPKETEVQMPTLLEQCLAKGATVGAFRVEDDWLDIGHHDQLRIAREGA